MRMAVTLKQIAERCEVSIRTVSCILNGDPSAFSAATRERVLEAARVLRYRPNASARAVRSGRFGAVAVVQAAHSYTHLPELVLRGMHEALAQRGQHLVFSIVPEERLVDPVGLPKALGALMVDGFLLNWSLPVPRALVRLLREYAIPGVWINHDVARDAVRPDDLLAGELLSRHLTGLGHRRLAWVDYRYRHIEQRHISREQRYQGFRRAASAVGATVELIAPDVLVPVEERTAHAEGWLRGPERPTAVAGYSEVDLGAVAHAALRLGLAFPRDVSFAGIGEQQQTLLGLPIATAVPRWPQLGARAVEMLLARIEAPATALPSVVIGADLLAGPGTVAAPR